MSGRHRGGTVFESVTAVFKRRDRLLSELADSAGRSVIDGTTVGTMTDAVIHHLPVGCKYSAVYRTLTSLLGKPFDKIQARKLCWAIAADIEAIRDDQPVFPGKFLSTATSVVVQILAACRIPAFRGKSHKGFPVKYRARVLVGRGAPHDFEFFWSSTYVAYVAMRPDGLGFGGFRRGGEDSLLPSTRPYRHFSTLVGMRMVLGVVQEENRLRVESFRCPESLRKFNQALTEMRWRAGFVCPFDFKHHCNACPKGQSSCQAAVRPLDLLTAKCVRCGKDEEIDPIWDSRVCLRCLATTKIKR